MMKEDQGSKFPYTNKTWTLRNRFTSNRNNPSKRKTNNIIDSQLFGTKVIRGRVIYQIE